MGKITPVGTGKNKTYTARAWWTNIKHERKSKQASGFTTQSAAQAWIDETEDTNKGLAFPEAHKLTMDGLYAIYLEHLRTMKRSPKTIEWYETQYKKIGEHIGPVLVQELQFLHIQNMFDAIKETPIEIPVRQSKLAPENRYTHQKDHKSQAKSAEEKMRHLPRSETIFAINRALRAVLNYSIKMGVRKTNPCKGVDLPKAQKHIAHIYSGEDLVTLMSLLQELHHPLYIPIILTVPYALRRGEALGVAWDVIDFEGKSIHIKRNWTIAYGKAILKGVKTEAAQDGDDDDIIAINDWTCQELRDLQKQRLQLGQMTSGKTPDPHTMPEGVVYEKVVVPSDFVCWDENGKLFRPDGMVGRLNAFQKANGLPRCTWHDLRHTYGTLMAEDGQDVVAISKAMRHSSVKITSDQYIEGTLIIKQRATTAFDNIIKMPAQEAEKNAEKN